MNKNGNYNPIENMLIDMRRHVSSLQEKLSVAEVAVNKSQILSEKISTMKEYEDKVSTINSCFRLKNRKKLVCNLQQENRQMIALEEENKQLRFSLKEMEEGLHLIMAEHRRIVSGFNRMNILVKLIQSNKYEANIIEQNKFMKFVEIVNCCLSAAEDKINNQDELIAQLQCENNTLREIAFFKPLINSKKQQTTSEVLREKQNDKTDFTNKKIQI